MTELDGKLSPEHTERDVSRRVMLRGVALGGLGLPVLAACGSDETDTAAEPAPSAAGSSAEGSPSESASVSGGTTVAVADVPVGGGVILAEEKIVVTQPTEGEFKAFDATCTHQGCQVKSVEGDQIVCPCHGSRFSITDGAPTTGPATAPLGNKTATVSGDRVSVA